MLALKPEETRIFSEYALSFLWLKGRFKNVNPTSFTGTKFAKKGVKEAKKIDACRQTADALWRNFQNHSLWK